ncbi:hypothetical protein EK21DRAFT_89436 [Setomelanomma holmii]|uniref:Uncharacterized protein n=1 Tax=Setomelanomma holmii TaxID=210430 RepID=A0A9P4H816_9PLEO|nr:hypothetical protein EK21DRAFT_89436 [Setomelanomma holmii]
MANKGMKAYKMAQKQKAVAKRTAAAEKVKEKKTVVVVNKTVPFPCEIEKRAAQAQHTTSSTIGSIAPNEKVLDVVGGAVEVRAGNFAVQDPTVHRGGQDTDHVGHGSYDGFSAEPDSISAALVDNIEYLATENIHRDDQKTSAETDTTLTLVTDQSPDLELGMVGEPDRAIDPAPLTNEFPTSLTDKATIIAHRKAIEAALYDNMESPKQRFIRLSAVKSWAAEALQGIVEDDHNTSEDLSVVDTSVDLKRSVDDNGFETSAGRYESTVETPALPPFPIQVLSKTPAPIRSVADACLPQPVSVEQLFAAAAAPGTPVVRLPAAPTHNTTRTTRILEEIEADITFEASDQVSAMFVDTAIVSCKVKEQPSVAEQTLAVSSPQFSDSARTTALDQDSEKLKALLGIGAPILRSTTTSDEGVEWLKSNLGVGRSRTSSLESSAQYSRDSSPPPDTGYLSPLTQYSTSPSPTSDHCGMGPLAYGYDNYQPWYLPPAHYHQYAPYSYAAYGSGAPPYMPNILAGKPNYTYGWELVGIAPY